MAAGVRLLDYCATGNLAVEGWLHEEALLLTLALHRQQRAAGIAGGVAEIGVTDVHHETYDAGHGAIDFRYPLSLAYLAERLAV